MIVFTRKGNGPKWSRSIIVAERQVWLPVSGLEALNMAYDGARMLSLGDGAFASVEWLIKEHPDKADRLRALQADFLARTEGEE
jgi:hypothetical protein